MPALILGATGNIGPHVVDELRRLGDTPRVLVRDGQRARALFGPDVEVVAGDATDSDAIRAAAEGMDSVFLLSPHSFTMADLQLGVIRALRRTGIRIIKLSGTASAITPDGPLACREHWEIEQVLEGSGQPFVILRPNSFLQVLVGKLMLPGIHSTGKIINPLGTAGISMIDARDVGAVAARVLTSHAWDGQTLSLTGPRPVTYAEIAEAVSARRGVPVAVADVTLDQVHASLTANGMAPWEAEHFREMYELFAAGASAFVTDTVREVTGNEPRTIEAYLDETLAAEPVTA
ncbi:NAD(P)H-binding protein [Microbacterium sp. EST19A]|uniref:NmrA family NAD(P)-binding protein n=1 Tax=Microbacterium sp. EST19A TaxID=2862681 RepID=UPI001CBCA974|nr:NAD(P)H-binding protein [Microbacterium sp. EST19A]